MRLVLRILVLALTAASLAAQDVEPTLQRAARKLARDLARELPFRSAAADALAVEVDPKMEQESAKAFVEALLQEGFRVQRAGSGAAGERVLPLRVGTRQAAELTVLSVEAASEQPYSAECAFGRAAWVDEPPSRADIVVAGPPQRTASAAIQAARDRLRGEVIRRYPYLARTDRGRKALAREPVRTFVASEGAGDEKTYVAYATAEPDVRRLASIDLAARRAAERSPLVRGGVIAGAAVVLWFSFLRQDLRTKGYRTGRLRLLFGSLFAIVVACVWSLPL